LESVNLLESIYLMCDVFRPDCRKGTAFQYEPGVKSAAAKTDPSGQNVYDLGGPMRGILYVYEDGPHEWL
jgi:hypothetical protein